MKEKVLLGMSGGVDSSVAAYLLKEQGYEVIGATMNVSQNDPYYEGMSGECCSLSSVEDARRVANSLEIPFYVLNFKDLFKEKVVDYFTKEYLKGNTPNPCIACNKYLKFDAFLQKALALGANYVATGHYSIIEQINGRYILKKGMDLSKDQSYVLYNMSQYQLQHTLMPCGKYSKQTIREIAKKIGLEVHNKKDSEEICFIPDNDHGGFISRQCPKKIIPGNFVDAEGNIIGRHKGIVYYTIGQRKGLGLSLGKKAFVINIDPIKNVVVIGEEKEIFKKELIASKLNFMPFDKITKPMEVYSKIRYSASPQKSMIYPLEEDKIKVVFENEVRAITKGQSVVFYDGDILVGGGIIIG